MGRVLYGMPTLIECDSLDETIKLCKELKLDFIEINMNLPQYQKNNIDINMMKSCILNDNIFFTIHLDENLKVCNFNEEVAKAYIDTVLFTISYKNHLPLGKCEIDIKYKINFAIKNNCTCVLETKSVEGLRESVQYLTNYIIN